MATGLARVVDWLRAVGRAGDAERAGGELKGPPHETLFAFIRMFAPYCTPAFLGTPLTYDGLSGVLLSARADPTEEARRILDAITGGGLKRLPVIARAYGKPLEGEAELILDKGAGRTAETLACAVAASEDPDRFIWGPPGPRRGEEAIRYVLEQGCPLLPVSWWEGVTCSGFPFPQERFNELSGNPFYRNDYRRISESFRKSLWQNLVLGDLLPEAVRGGFPAVSVVWGLKNDEGDTLAHEAAWHGELPEGYDRWEEANRFGESVAHVAARHGKLPHGFDRWGIVNRYGESVAHTAAEHGHIPEGFDKWEIADRNGNPVSHVAARNGSLPDGFDRWEITDSSGESVAHAALTRGKLPKGFDRWGLKDSRGKTVAWKAGLATWLKYKLGLL